MKQDNYLINYYKNNNPVIDRITLKKRFIVRIIILAICSLLYLFMSSFESLSKFRGGIELLDTFNVLKIIMIVTLVITAISLIGILITLIMPKQTKLLYDMIPFKLKKNLFVILDWYMVLPICIVITVFCFSYIFIITPVSGSSMMPNIENGEYVLVSYHKEIKRDLVVVLEVNREDNFLTMYDEDYSHYIKRIVGLPGDTVKIIDNILYINNVKYEQTYYSEEDINWSKPNKDFDGELFYKKDGESHKTYIIPEGYYFVLGDNRGGSKDSREIGLIPEENIIGVATYHMYYFIPRGKL